MSEIDGVAFVWSCLSVIGEFYLLGWSVHRTIESTLKTGKIRVRWYVFLLFFRWMFLGGILWAGIHFFGFKPGWVITGVLAGTVISLIGFTIVYGRSKGNYLSSFSIIHTHGREGA